MATHLVTGGSGFIGAALVKALIARGHSVRVLDDGSRGRPRRLESCANAYEMVHGDVRDPATVERATEGCEIVWHLAYVNGTRFFYEKPDVVLEVGVKGTLATLDAAMKCGVERYVLASTSETYNRPTHVPTDETERLMIPDVTNPRFSYGGGKITAELLTLHYGGRRGLETAIVRPHNIYGPDMGFEHVIPEVVARIFRRSERGALRRITLPIQGDGSETRAFCYIDDGAEGFAIAGDRGENGGIYHLGREEEVSIRDLIERIGRALEIELDIQPGELRPGGTPRRCPAIGKLTALGYEPAVDLDTGLARTVRWYWDWYAEHGCEGVGE